LNFSFTMSDSGETVSIVGATSTEDLADQLSDAASSLGITVDYDSDTDELIVTSESGESFEIGAMTKNDGTALTDALTANVMDAEGNYTADITIVDEDTIVGYVQLDSSDSFSITDDGSADVSEIFDATTSSLTAITDTDISTDFGSQLAISVIDEALSSIDSDRASLGAVQNRFDSTIANLQSIQQNADAARGRIEDTDFASETAELTKQQTLQQASTAILAQANQLPSSVLSLLR